MKNRFLYAAGMLLALSGCGTTQVGFSDPAARTAALERFHAGSAGMSCGTGFACMLKWNASRGAAQRFAAARRWDDVADVVLSAGMDIDLGWFYLGLAAQGEGRASAARAYYNMSVRRTLAGGVYACAAVNSDNCEGVTLPEDANSMMAQLRGTTRYAAPRRRAPTARSATVTATPASTGWVAPAPASSGSGSSFVTPAPASGSSASPAPASGSSGGWVAPAK